jgi:hypothetical protein
VQGRLRNRPLLARIESRCGGCARTVRLRVDSELRSTVLDPGVRPLIFEPEVDWARFRAPNILDDY